MVWARQDAHTLTLRADRAQEAARHARARCRRRRDGDWLAVDDATAAWLRWTLGR
jgi:hypothetical protein